jgi:hypothetical protein
MERATELGPVIDEKRTTTAVTCDLAVTFDNINRPKT